MTLFNKRILIRVGLKINKNLILNEAKPMNEAPYYPNFDILKARLDLAGERLRTIAEGLDLPAPPPALIREIKEAHLPANLERLVLFLISNNGSRTDAISESQAIGNVSDCYTKPRTREQLRQLALTIKCEILPACNRFGAATVMGHLFIQPLPHNEHWQPRQAANDT